MSLTQQLYDRLPGFMQSAALSYYGWRLRRKRHGAVYRSERARLLRKDWSDRSAEYAAQETGLQGLLHHAVSCSPFYAELYRGIDLSTIRTSADLGRLPIVSKETLRTEMARIRTIPPREGIVAFTGGTTGTSLEVVFTRHDFQRRMAYLDAFKIRCGVDPDRGRKATFSGRRILSEGQPKGAFWRTNWAYRQRLYSTFHLKADTIEAYLDDLERWRPEQINGFVSAISSVAAFMVQSGRRLSTTPKGVFTTSETLLPHHRQLIEAAFECRVFNQYSSAEGAPFVTECQAGQLHYNIDTGVIESWEGPSGPEILVTSFTSYGTPLIRYRIGDLMTFGGEGCSCGSSHPIVTQIDGRAVEYLVGKGGRRVSTAHLSDVIKGLPNTIRAMQFIQESPETVRALIVVGKGVDPEVVASEVGATMRYRFGEDFPVSLEFVPEIPLTAGGKRPFVRNLVPRDRE